MKRVYILLAGLIVGIIITGFFFSSVSLSGAQGDRFYACIKNDNYNEIIDLLDKEALKEIPEQDWLKILHSKSNEMGNLISYKNIGLHTETIKGLSIIRLDYLVNYSNGKRNEKIEFIKRDSDFKILTYKFSGSDPFMFSMK